MIILCAILLIQNYISNIIPINSHLINNTSSIDLNFGNNSPNSYERHEWEYGTSHKDLCRSIRKSGVYKFEKIWSYRKPSRINEENITLVRTLQTIYWRLVINGIYIAKLYCNLENIDCIFDKNKANLTIKSKAKNETLYPLNLSKINYLNREPELSTNETFIHICLYTNFNEHEILLCMASFDKLNDEITYVEIVGQTLKTNPIGNMMFPYTSLPIHVHNNVIRIGIKSCPDLCSLVNHYTELFKSTLVFQDVTLPSYFPKEVILNKWNNTVHLIMDLSYITNRKFDHIQHNSTELSLIWLLKNNFAHFVDGDYRISVYCTSINNRNTIHLLNTKTLNISSFELVLKGPINQIKPENKSVVVYQFIPLEFTTTYFNYTLLTFFQGERKLTGNYYKIVFEIKACTNIYRRNLSEFCIKIKKNGSYRLLDLFSLITSDKIFSNHTLSIIKSHDKIISWKISTKQLRKNNSNPNTDILLLLILYKEFKGITLTQVKSNFYFEFNNLKENIMVCGLYIWHRKEPRYHCIDLLQSLSLFKNNGLKTMRIVQTKSYVKAIQIYSDIKIVSVLPDLYYITAIVSQENKHNYSHDGPHDLMIKLQECQIVKPDIYKPNSNYSCKERISNTFSNKTYSGGYDIYYNMTDLCLSVTVPGVYNVLEFYYVYSRHIPIMYRAMKLMRCDKAVYAVWISKLQIKEMDGIYSMRFFEDKQVSQMIEINRLSSKTIQNSHQIQFQFTNVTINGGINNFTIISTDSFKSLEFSIINYTRFDIKQTSKAVILDILTNGTNFNQSYKRYVLWQMNLTTFHYKTHKTMIKGDLYIDIRKRISVCQ